MSNIEFYIKLLKSPDEGERAKAAEYLGNNKTEEGFKALIGASEEKSPIALVEIIESLGEFWDRDYSNLDKVGFLREFVDHEHELVRSCAIEALWKYQDKSILDKLKNMAADDKEDSLVRCYAISAIGFLGGEEDKTFLVLLKNRIQDPEMELRIYEALYYLGENDVFEDLAGMLRNDSYRVRCAAAYMLADIAIKDFGKKALIIGILENVLETEESVATQSSIKNALDRLK